MSSMLPSVDDGDSDGNTPSFGPSLNTPPPDTCTQDIQTIDEQPKMATYEYAFPMLSQTMQTQVTLRAETVVDAPNSVPSKWHAPLWTQVWETPNHPYRKNQTGGMDMRGKNKEESSAAASRSSSASTVDKSSPNGFSRLASVEFSLVFQYLDFTSLLACARTSKQLRREGKQPFAWKFQRVQLEPLARQLAGQTEIDDSRLHTVFLSHAVTTFTASHTSFDDAEAIEFQVRLLLKAQKLEELSLLAAASEDSIGMSPAALTEILSQESKHRSLRVLQLEYSFVSPVELPSLCSPRAASIARWTPFVESVCSLKNLHSLTLCTAWPVDMILVKIGQLESLTSLQFQSHSRWTPTQFTATHLLCLRECQHLRRLSFHDARTCLTDAHLFSQVFGHRSFQSLETLSFTLAMFPQPVDAAAEKPADGEQSMPYDVPCMNLFGLKTLHLDYCENPESLVPSLHLCPSLTVLHLTIFPSIGWMAGGMVALAHLLNERPSCTVYLYMASQETRATYREEAKKMGLEKRLIVKQIATR